MFIVTGDVLEVSGKQGQKVRVLGGVDVLKFLAFIYVGRTTEHVVAASVMYFSEWGDS